MPGYRCHTTINFLALAGLAYAGFQHPIGSNQWMSIGAGSFVVATLLLSPDLDLRHSSPTKNWGLLRFVWRPYQMLFKHRGLSHSLLFSSATRVGYLVVLAALALAVGGASYEWVTVRVSSDVWSHRDELTALAAGLFLSDLCHILTDRIVSTAKDFVKFG